MLTMAGILDRPILEDTEKSILRIFRITPRTSVLVCPSKQKFHKSEYSQTLYRNIGDIILTACAKLTPARVVDGRVITPLTRRRDI